MESDTGFATLAARLASFQSSAPAPTKKRQSNARAQKPISWPHKSPAPAELAHAGFYYKPTPDNPDNTVCFLCERALDGWEEDDDPISEHTKHSPDCAWAILMNLSQESHDTSTMEDPTHDSIANARRATFASGWPHDGKRGWGCKTDKMVEAGWHFAPAPESEDFVSCVYCKLSLDGWEPKDHPFDEHHRRSPECPFFTFAGTSASKASRGQKARSSRGGRQSTQPVARVPSQAQSIPELDESIDTSSISVMSTASVIGKKKATRGGRKVQKVKPELVNTVTAEQDESVLEIPAPSTKTAASSGKKRTSEQISEDDHGGRESTVKPEPATKRRNTRTRNSAMSELADLSLLSQAEPTDFNGAPAKSTRGGRKRASSVSRQGSRRSKVSSGVGDQPKVPDDATIEAALEADLNRPLSDEEESAARPAAMKRGRQKQGTDQPQFEAEVGKHEAVSQDVVLGSATKGETGKPRTAKALAKKTKTGRASVESNATGAGQPNGDATLTGYTLGDDSGHETDASVANKGIARKTSKKKAPGKGRGKKMVNQPNRVSLGSEMEDQTNTVAAEVLLRAGKADAALAAAVDADQMDIDERIAELTKEIDEEDAPKKPTKSSKPAKAKTTKGKGSKKEKVPQLSMPGAFSPLNMDSVEPSFASVLSTNTPPVKSALQVVKAATPQEFEMDMEIRSPEEQSTPTPRRVVAPPLPPRSSTRPTPTTVAPALSDKSPTARQAPTPSKTSGAGAPLSPQHSSGQASDAENAPPSSLPEKIRPPLQPVSPSEHVILQPGTPSTARPVGIMLSPSKIGGLQSELPWSVVDVEMIFQGADTKENDAAIYWTSSGSLSSPAKRLTVEQWINENARRAEEQLRAEGERVVGLFEQEGQRAMRVLEGIVREV